MGQVAICFYALANPFHLLSPFSYCLSTPNGAYTAQNKESRHPVQGVAVANPVPECLHVLHQNELKTSGVFPPIIEVELIDGRRNESQAIRVFTKKASHRPACPSRMVVRGNHGNDRFGVFGQKRPQLVTLVHRVGDPVTQKDNVIIWHTLFEQDVSRDQMCRRIVGIVFKWRKTRHQDAFCESTIVKSGRNERPAIFVPEKYENGVRLNGARANVEPMHCSWQQNVIHRQKYADHNDRHN